MVHVYFVFPRDLFLGCLYRVIGRSPNLRSDFATGACAIFLCQACRRKKPNFVAVIQPYRSTKNTLGGICGAYVGIIICGLTSYNPCMNFPLSDEFSRPCRDPCEVVPPSDWILLKSPYLNMTAHYYDPKSGFMYSKTPQSPQFVPYDKSH